MFVKGLFKKIRLNDSVADGRRVCLGQNNGEAERMWERSLIIVALFGYFRTISLAMWNENKEGRNL